MPSMRFYYQTWLVLLDLTGLGYEAQTESLRLRVRSEDRNAGAQREACTGIPAKPAHCGRMATNFRRKVTGVSYRPSWAGPTAGAEVAGQFGASIAVRCR